MKTRMCNRDRSSNEILAANQNPKASTRATVVRSNSYGRFRQCTVLLLVLTASGFAAAPARSESKSNPREYAEAVGDIKKAIADKDFDAAIGFAREAIQIDEESGEGYSLLAIALIRTGHKDEAAQAIVEALKRVQREERFGLYKLWQLLDPDAVVEAAQSRARAGSEAQLDGLLYRAALEYEDAWRLAPPKEEWGLKGARAYLGVKRFLPALSICRELELSENESIVEQTQALLAQMRPTIERIYEERLEAARRTFTTDAASSESNLLEATRIDPYQPDAYFNLARLYANSKDSEGALQALRMAIRNGIRDRKRVVDDTSLFSLRSSPRYLDLIHDIFGPDVRDAAVAEYKQQQAREAAERRRNEEMRMAKKRADEAKTAILKAAALRLEVNMPDSISGASAELLLKLNGQINTGDHKGSLESIRRLRYYSVASGRPALHYFEGNAHWRLNDITSAESALARYVDESGQSAKHWDQARSLLNQIRTQFHPRGILTNSIGMKLVGIPAGEFRMGSTEHWTVTQNDFNERDVNIPNAFSDEHPRHRVEISRNLYMSQHEVTVGQFRRFVIDADYVTEAERDGSGGSGFNPQEAKNIGKTDDRSNWRNPGYRITDNHPVVLISWNDANAFLTWLNERESDFYRLPTEAEWEYAARAGTTTRFWTGNSPESLAGSANVPDRTYRNGSKGDLGYATIRGDDGYFHTAPVGTFRPNPWGLYDVHGNVWEWCYDGYDATYYQRSDVQSPFVGGQPRFRILRGGCYM